MCELHREFHVVRIGGHGDFKRPEFGLKGAIARLAMLADGAVSSIPDCPGQTMLRGLILQETRRLLPAKLATA
jgi:hypothetical protein